MSMEEQATRGLADMEAYLYQEAHLSAARLRVAAFIAQSAELTHQQKRNIEEWYLDEQKYVAGMVTRHIVDSIAKADSAQRRRFLRWMRRLLIAMAILTLLTFAGTVLLVSSGR
ncbi:hypothetical protein GCM10010329_51030 [Streptomyces spiroverticillatus]|uniref:Uncharacterized protein n=1 Tax=Streptomyces finlayi TaxID=67296 RepID=A0A918X1V5_9ACTN|nr:hypothetical protein [Streptomyces finlayi]GHA21525.1 hypothetical protein GCM10010329_51030 [Streptomyces spiroverticillatus]GHD03875.1 hypothetical protein GCM10010334_51980 [Streptomyces finlayi]